MILALILAALLCGPWTCVAVFGLCVAYRAALARVAR